MNIKSPVGGTGLLIRRATVVVISTKMYNGCNV
jgi:hypothetical protein